MDGLALFLTGDRGLAVARALIGAGHQIWSAWLPHQAAVETMSHVIEGLGIPADRVADVNDPSFLERYANRRPQLAIVAGFPQIFRQPAIDVPAFGTINLHGGPLPAYRGGSPLNWQIINGEREIGLSVIRMDEGIDTGPVLVERRFDLSIVDDIATVHARADRLFAEMAVETINAYAAGSLSGREQTGPATYWHQRCDTDGEIDWRAMTAQQVFDLVRAVTRPYPGAWTLHAGKRVRLWRIGLTDVPVRGQPGRVCRVNGATHVICSDRAVIVEEASHRLPAGILLAASAPSQVTPAEGAGVHSVAGATDGRLAFTAGR